MFKPTETGSRARQPQVGLAGCIERVAQIRRVEKLAVDQNNTIYEEDPLDSTLKASRYRKTSRASQVQ